LRSPRENLLAQKLALTLPTSCGRSVCIVRLWTKATEFSFTSIIFNILFSFTHLLNNSASFTTNARSCPLFLVCPHLFCVLINHSPLLPAISIWASPFFLISVFYFLLFVSFCFLYYFGSSIVQVFRSQNAQTVQRRATDCRARVRIPEATYPIGTASGQGPTKSCRDIVE
jgi:hypothetical protein